MHVISFIRSYFLLLLATVLIVGGVLLNTRFGCETVTSGGSKVRRPGDGSTVIYERRPARASAFQHGEPVLFLVARNKEDKLLTGRVVGIAGDTVGIIGGKLVRNGAPVDETIDRKNFAEQPEFLVPSGMLWVLADNPGGADSRRYGPVPVEAVRGAVVNGND